MKDEEDFAFPQNRDDFLKLTEKQQSIVCYKLGRDFGKSSNNTEKLMEFFGIDKESFLEALNNSLTEEEK